MTDDYDVRGMLITAGSDVMAEADRNTEPGSEEQARAYNAGKALFDVCAKYEEIEFKEKELAYKQQQLEQELQIHNDNQKIAIWKNVLDGAKVLVGGVFVGVGYVFNFKHNGIELNEGFKSIKRNFLNIFK